MNNRTYTYIAPRVGLDTTRSLCDRPDAAGKGQQPLGTGSRGETLNRHTREAGGKEGSDRGSEQRTEYRSAAHAADEETAVGLGDQHAREDSR